MADAHRSYWSEQVVKNGERLVAGATGSEIPVVHVTGTAFEMGEAHGKLMAKELKEFAEKMLISTDLEDILDKHN